MIQSIEQALSGFSMVLFTVVVSVFFAAISVLVCYGIFLGTRCGLNMMAEEMPLDKKLMARTITKAKKEKAMQPAEIKAVRGKG